MRGLRPDADVVKAFAGDEKITGASSLSELAEKLSAPRVVWVMVPAGTITSGVIDELANTLDAGDIVIDGGNSYYRDDLKHAKTLSEKGIHLLRLWHQRRRVGPERGYCLMIGGDDDAFEHAEPISRSSRRGSTRRRAPRVARARSRNRRRVTCIAGRPAPGTSSRWCTTVSSTG